MQKRALSTFGTLATVGLASWALYVTSTDATGRQSSGMLGTVSCRDGRIPIRSLPFLIDECGSYFVADCLTGVPGEHGITIDSDDVTLDLNGFTLVGVPGSRDGVHVTNGRTGISIGNGVVRNWGTDGVDAINAEGVRLFGLQLNENEDDGLRAGDGSTITDCLARHNGDDGIVTGKATRMTGCTSAFNADDGIIIGTANVVDDCTSESNGDNGFTMQDTNIVRNCIAMKNGDYGFFVNLVANRLEDNLAAANQLGAFKVNAFGNVLFANTATGAGSTYSITPGNTYGQILTNPGDGFVNDNPWANFRF